MNNYGLGVLVASIVIPGGMLIGLLIWAAFILSLNYDLIFNLVFLVFPGLILGHLGITIARSGYATFKADQEYSEYRQTKN